jgi:LysR family transcriptional regulator, pca operon transcriptional activator
MTVTLDEMRVFAAAAETGSLGAAARSLGLSQPSASERLAQLERKLAARLLIRSPRGVRLSPEGTRFLPYARRCLQVADEGVHAVKADAGTATFTLALHGMFSSLVGHVIEALARRHLQIVTKDAHSEQIIQLLADGHADAGIVVDQPHPPSLTLHRLLVTPAIAVAAPQHSLTGRARLRVADLAQGPVAANAWGSGTGPFFEFLGQAQLPAHALRQVATAETATQLARHHGHVAIVFEASVGDDLRSGDLARLAVTDLPNWTLELFLAYRNTDRDRPEIAALRRLPAGQATDQGARMA